LVAVQFGNSWCIRQLVEMSADVNQVSICVCALVIQMESEFPASDEENICRQHITHFAAILYPLFLNEDDRFKEKSSKIVIVSCIVDFKD
jgi:hypothetical protein